MGYNTGMKYPESNFTFFWGGIFSQFQPFQIVVNDIMYSCNEQYMMWSKADLFNDERSKKLILAEKNPYNIQALGRGVRGYDQETWDSHKREVVYRGNLAKFTQNEVPKMALKDTGHTIIVEASPKDPIWGIGLPVGHPDTYDPNKWRGTNYLGEALMRVREELFPELTRLKLS